MKFVSDTKLSRFLSKLATVAKTGSYNDLTNKPTIPVVPTLATVATTGNYNDLSNKPSIPSVGNGTLTIQKNGTNIATFTANQSGNTTANIAVSSGIGGMTSTVLASGVSSYTATQDCWAVFYFYAGEGSGGARVRFNFGPSSVYWGLPEYRRVGMVAPLKAGQTCSLSDAVANKRDTSWGINVYAAG